MDARAGVASLNWYHQIDIGGGIATPGSPGRGSQAWITSQLPRRFDGLSVLDIGAWDGYYSFLAEERGARLVLAIDNLQNSEAHSSGTAPFELAKTLRGSSVEYRLMDVMDLDRMAETFDIILFLGVYYHLLNPGRALEIIRRRLNPGGKVYLEGLYMLGTTPLLRFLDPTEVEPTSYTVATESGLATLARVAGFQQTRTLAKRKGLGNLSYALRKHLPRRLPLGEARSEGATDSFSARLLQQVRGRRGFWPRILMVLQP